MTEHNAKEIGLHICRQRETLGYSRGRLTELPEIPNSFLPDIERGDRGFSVVLLGRSSRVLRPSADYMLFRAEQVTDVSAITDMLSNLDGKYLPEFKELLGVYLETTIIAEKQDD